MPALVASMLVAAAVAAAEPAPPEPPARENVNIEVLRDDCGRECWWPPCGNRGPAQPEQPKLPGSSLSSKELLTEIQRLEPDIRACAGPADVGGLVMVRIVIGANGRVAAATATGRFEGTPTGACVEQKVKSMQFRASNGLTLNYPFRFRARATISPTEVSDELETPSLGSLENLQVERALICALGSVADCLPARWYVVLRPRWPKSGRVTGTEEQLRKLLGIPGVTVDDHGQSRRGPGQWQLTVNAADQNAVDELQRRGFVLELHDPIVVDPRDVGLP